MKKKNQKGFTMIELIISIAIMGIISAALAPSFVNMTRRTKLKSDIQSVQTFQSMIDIYTADHDGEPPKGLETSNGMILSTTVYEALLNGGYISLNDVNEEKNSIDFQTKGATLQYSSEKDQVIMHIDYKINDKIEKIVADLSDRERNWIITTKSTVE